MARSPYNQLAPEGVFGAQIIAHPTPMGLADMLFHEAFDANLPANEKWKYGDQHPDNVKFPDHRLVFVTPGREQGSQIRYYASKRLLEDDYNFEFSDADIGGVKFCTVVRTYVQLRSEFNPEGHQPGELMSRKPGTLFHGDFIMARFDQQRIGQEELDALFVVKRLTYIQRCSIARVELDIQTGNSKRSITELFYVTEVVAGVPIEDLAANPNDPYWGLQSNGIFRELEQLSANWYAVTTSTAIAGGGIPLGPENPAKTRVIERPTPIVGDIIFYETGVMPSPVPAYGTPHYLPAEFPNHKLAFIRPADKTGFLYEFVYVADRPNQDSYNFEFTQADIGGTKFNAVQRTYVTPRSGFTPLVPAQGAAMASNAGLPTLTASEYILAERKQTRSGDREIDNLYVIDVHTYVKRSSTAEISYNERTNESVSATTTLYHRGELVGGVAIEVLVADVANDYWGLWTDTDSRTGNQLTTDWFAVVETKSAPKRRNTDGSIVEGWAVQQVKTTGQDDLTPAKFRGQVTTSVTRTQEILPAADVNDIPNPASPVGDENRIEHEKVNEFRFEKRVSTEVIQENVIPLDGEKFAPDGAIIKVAERLVVDNTPSDKGVNIAASEVDPLGNGKSIKQTQSAKRRTIGDVIEDGWPQKEKKSKGQDNPIPSQFRGLVTTSVTTTQEPLAAAEVNNIPDPATPSGSQILIEHEKVNDYRYERRVVSEIIAEDAAINDVRFDEATGRSYNETTSLYHGSDSLGGTTVELLFLDPTNVFWDQQVDGTFRTGQQLSVNLYAVKTSVVVPPGAVNGTGNVALTRIVERITPTGTDLIIMETGTMPGIIPVYGSPHYELSGYLLSHIEPADKSGKLFQFFYVKARAGEDAYNFEFTQADIGGTKFDAVKRTYVTLRSAFTPYTPLQGATMVDLPVGLFTGVHVLADRTQVRTNEPKIDSLFVIDVQTYVLKTTIRQLGVDTLNGKMLYEDTTLYYRGETVAGGGGSVESLFATPSNSFWGLQSNGTQNRGQQISTAWFAVITEQVVGGSFSGGKVTVDAVTGNQDYYWPPVLETIDFMDWVRLDGGIDIYPAIRFHPEGYNGPCACTTVRTWSIVPVDILAVVIMQPTRIYYACPYFTLNVPECLHGRISPVCDIGNADPIYDQNTGSQRNFAATTPPVWPVSIVAYDDQEPFRGGYLRTTKTIFAPPIPPNTNWTGL